MAHTGHVGRSRADVWRAVQNVQAFALQADVRAILQVRVERRFGWAGHGLAGGLGCLRQMGAIEEGRDGQGND